MSYKTWAFTPPFLLRNFAHGNVARHNGIVAESLLNQTHISFRKCQGCWSSASRRLLSSYRMQILQKFCNHGSGWLSQELSWISVHNLTQDDIAWPYAPRKQRLSLAGSHGYSVVQTSLRASDSNKWNVSAVNWENTYLSWNIAAICIRLQSCKIKSVSFQKTM